MNDPVLPTGPAAGGRPLPDPIAAVVFDMDGTLIDTEAVHGRTMRQAAEALGQRWDEDVFLSMVGVHRDENMAMLVRHYGDTFPLERFYADSDALFEAALDAGLPMRPGVEAILDHLDAAGIPAAIATSTLSPWAEGRLERAGILHRFKVIVTRSDVTRPKPDPQSYLLAAERLGVAPRDCVAVEDSYAGVRAAVASGMATVMVPDLLPATEELTAQVARVLPGLDDLRALIAHADAQG